MNLEKKTYYKYFIRHIVADIYLGKWLRMNAFRRWIEPRLGLEATANARTLDIGTGDGILAFYLSRRYPKLTVIGADIKEEKIRANEYVVARVGIKNLTFTVMDIMKPHIKEPCDYIFAFDILEHLEDDATALKNCAELLLPNGHLIINAPNRLMRNERGEWIPSLGPPDHLRTGYDLEVLEGIIREANLKPIFHHYYIGKKLIKAWRLYSRLDKIGRPLTLIGMPFYKCCFLLESDPSPMIGNAFFLIAKKLK